MYVIVRVENMGLKDMQTEHGIVMVVLCARWIMPSPEKSGFQGRSPEFAEVADKKERGVRRHPAERLLGYL